MHGIVGQRPVQGEINRIDYEVYGNLICSMSYSNHEVELGYGASTSIGTSMVFASEIVASHKATSPGFKSYFFSDPWT